MRPYPWYEINGLTRELEPYARYSYDRLNFERYYQPEPLAGGKITIGSLKDSISGDEERYHWMLFHSHALVQTCRANKICQD